MSTDAWSILLTVAEGPNSQRVVPSAGRPPSEVIRRQQHHIGRQHTALAMSSISAPSWLTSIPQGTRILSGATIVLSLLLSVARANHNRAVPGLGAVFGEAAEAAGRSSLHSGGCSMLTMPLS